MFRSVIRGFRNRETERVWRRELVKALGPDVQKIALRKLAMIDAAKDLNDLRVPPGNQLEALKGDRKGQHSVRVNDQWRICFVWRNGDAYDVEIVDYHKG